MKHCLQNMNCFSWIMLGNSSSDTSQILILQYPIPSAFLPPSSFPSNFTLANWKPYPHHVFHRFPYLILAHWQHATKSIWYTKPYASPSQSNFLSSYIRIIITYGSNLLPIKVRQHGQQQLYIQYKVCWILYKMVGAPSFSQPHLWIQTPLQSPPKICSSTSVSFHILIPPLLVY